MTTNLLFLADNQGLMLACSEPISGEHTEYERSIDLYQIKTCFDGLCLLLQQAGISLEGVCLNAGFDSLQFRGQCVEKKIEANISKNSRSSKDYLADHYFDQ
jgi:hypothetical protein